MTRIVHCTQKQTEDRHFNRKRLSGRGRSHHEQQHRTTEQRKGTQPTPDDDDDHGGYGNPPRHSRFKPGQSGNPKGRPPGSKNIKTLFLEIGNEKITVTENGRTKTMTKSEAAIRQLYNVAMKADLRAMREVLRFQGVAEEAQANDPEHKVLEEKDRAAMKRMQARMQAMANKPEEKT